ncbi:hypothetical protein [Streptomyces sp. NPDC005046]
MNRTRRARCRASVVAAMAVALCTSTATTPPAQAREGLVRLVNRTSGKCIEGDTEFHLYMAACSSDRAQGFTMNGTEDDAEFVWAVQEKCIEGETEITLGSCGLNANNARETEWEYESGELRSLFREGECLQDGGDKGLQLIEEGQDAPGTKWDILPF